MILLASGVPRPIPQCPALVSQVLRFLGKPEHLAGDRGTNRDLPRHTLCLPGHPLILRRQSGNCPALVHSTSILSNALQGRGEATRKRKQQAEHVRRRERGSSLLAATQCFQFLAQAFRLSFA